MGVPEGIVYVDERIVVLDKPPGVSLQTRRAEPGAAVERLLGALPPDQVAAHGLDARDLLLVHRLDVGTSGLVLLARDPEAHRELSRAMGGHAVERVYLAVVWGHPSPAAGLYGSPIGPDRRDRRRMAVDLAGRRALTRYRSLAAALHVSLVELRPETGRTHQIRVHLAAAGHWIVGDDLYAGARHRAVRDPHLRLLLSAPHTLLHAWRLALPESRLTPVRFFEAPPPPAFLAALDGLGIELPLDAY